MFFPNNQLRQTAPINPNPHTHHTITYQPTAEPQGQGVLRWAIRGGTKGGTQRGAEFSSLVACVWRVPFLGRFQRPGETMWNVYQPSFEGFFIYHLRIAGGMVELMSTIGDCEILKYICLVYFVGCRVYNIMGHHSIPHILRFYCRSCLVIHLHPFLLAIII